MDLTWQLKQFSCADP